MDQIESAKRRTVTTMEQFLRNFSHVPDEKLEWRASPSAKSPLRIAAHTALYASRFAWMIRERRFPTAENLEQWLAQRDAEEIAVTRRDEIEPIFRSGTAEVLAALDAIRSEDIEAKGENTLPHVWVIDLPSFHAALHMGQIDFLQTCWGDQEVYVG